VGGGEGGSYTANIRGSTCSTANIKIFDFIENSGQRNSVSQMQQLEG
jgi:hypothetical protein